MKEGTRGENEGVGRAGNERGGGVKGKGGGGGGGGGGGVEEKGGGGVKEGMREEGMSK